MKKCPSCGTNNPDTENVCAQCGAFLQRSDYRASVASGLKRLESEKLSFLGNQQIVSKFNPEHVEQYTSAVDFQTDTLDNAEIFSDQDTVSRDITPTNVFRNPKTGEPSRFQNLRVSGVLTETAVRTVEAIESLTPTVANVENPEVVTLNFAALRGKSSSENKKVPESTAPQSQVFIPNSVVPRERPEIDEEMPAVEKLRVQGLFNTLESGDVMQRPSDEMEEVSAPDVSSQNNQTDSSEQTGNPETPSVDESESLSSLSTAIANLNHDVSEIQKLKEPVNPVPTEILESVGDVSGEKKSHLIYAVLLAVILCGIGYLVYATGMLADIHPILNPWNSSEGDSHGHVVIKPSITPIVDDSFERNSEIIQRAAMDIHDVVRIDSWFDSWLEEEEALDESTEARKDRYGLAIALFPHRFRYLLKNAEIMIEAGQIQEARTFMRSLSHADFADPEMRDLYFKTFEEDKYFLPNTLNINDDVSDEIAPLGGGSTLTFKIMNKGNIVGAFKPHQTRRQSNYLSEIAAWRLCELLQCDFDIPYNRPVKIEQETFNRLYNNSKSSKKELYRPELVDIIWTKDKASGKNYVYGTLKDWVPDFTRFPIEYLSMWQGWLAQEEYIQSFPLLKHALFPMTQRENTTHLYGTVLNQSSTLTTEQLASQISQLLTFDYLIGNWDRFSGVPEWWGVNCQFARDHIVSIDNGASFPTYCNERVIQKFMYVERFSRHFIDALRSLNKEETFRLLFPGQTSYERANCEQFWKQRSLVLSRIDSLSEKYGVDRVLSFE